RQTIDRCPDAMWDDAADKSKVWYVTHHVLFYTHLYLSDTEKDFKRWTGEKPEGQPYTRAEVLEYLAFCQQLVAEKVPHLNLEAESGFFWLPFNKLELQIYNIRHLQQHTGELYERLGTRAGIEFDWVSTK
ncbi:MAG TPA: DinB family protein, partial [Anaerolineae bacterium]